MKLNNPLILLTTLAFTTLSPFGEHTLFAKSKSSEKRAKKERAKQKKEKNEKYKPYKPAKPAVSPLAFDKVKAAERTRLILEEDLLGLDVMYPPSCTAFFQQEFFFKTKDGEKQTIKVLPLTFALLTEKRGPVFNLLEKTNVKTAKRNTAFSPFIFLAIDSSDDDIFDAVAEVEGINLNEKNREGKTPLIYAIERGLEDRAVRLLELGASIETADARGNTPLMAAAKAGSTKLLDLLLQQDLDVNESLRRGVSLLSLAEENPNSKEVKSLLAEWGAKEVDGGTPRND